MSDNGVEHQVLNQEFGYANIDKESNLLKFNDFIFYAKSGYLEAFNTSRLKVSI